MKSMNDLKWITAKPGPDARASAKRAAEWAAKKLAKSPYTAVETKQEKEGNPPGAKTEYPSKEGKSTCADGRAEHKDEELDKKFLLDKAKDKITMKHSALDHDVFIVKEGVGPYGSHH
jgi:hypothetical protein